MGRGWGWSFGRWSCAEGEHIPLWRGQNLGQASKGGGFGWRADLGQAWKSRTGKLVTASPGACRVDYVFHQRKNDNSKALPARFALIATAIHALLIHSSAHKRTGRPHRCLSKAPHSHQGSRRPPKAHSQFIIHATRHSLRSHWWHEASPEPSASAARRLAPNRFSAPVASPPHARVSEIPVRNRDQRRNRRRDALSEMRRNG